MNLFIVNRHSHSQKPSRYEDTSISWFVNDDARHGVTLMEPYTEEATLAELKWPGGFYMEARKASKPADTNVESAKALWDSLESKNMA
ncbi:hypothetical protein Tco_0485439 [Tanacetum coccineum]